ncbi:hypothetical protein, partial [Paenibacillus sp. Y412MC10]|uniref:hypothetical protein n=1 Tax=Geobacillus sp. (strain Y412MC10) TaxID=481743 RepID=UPI001C92E3B2
MMGGLLKCGMGVADGECLRFDEAMPGSRWATALDRRWCFDGRWCFNGRWRFDEAGASMGVCASMDAGAFMDA